MSNLVALGDCTDRCLTWNPAADDPDGEFDYIDLSSINKDTKRIEGISPIACSAAPSRARQIVKAGDILVSTVRPNLNGVATVPVELDGATASTGYTVLRPRLDRIDSSYLFHWVKHPEFVEEMVRLATGASYPAVSDKIVRAAMIPLPSLPEQRRIGAIMDKADALRAKRREAIAKLDQLLQSVFLEMFGDPVTNPKGWPIKPVGDCCEKVTVGIVVKPASYYVDTGIPAIRSLNIGVNRILDREFVYFSEQDNFGPLKKTILRAGDVVAVRSGQPGKAAVIPPEFDGANAIDVLIARTKLSILLPEFLAHFLNSSAGKKLVLAEQRGQVQKHLNVKQLSEAGIPLPPLSEQKKFLTFATALNNLEGNLKRSSVELEAVFSGIQSRAFAAR